MLPEIETGRLKLRLARPGMEASMASFLSENFTGHLLATHLHGEVRHGGLGRQREEVDPLEEGEACVVAGDHTIAISGQSIVQNAIGSNYGTVYVIQALSGG